MLKRLAPSLARFEARPTEEREVMRNRMALSCIALVAALAAQAEGEEARVFLRSGLPILLAYLLGAAALMVHMSLRPAISRVRLALALSMDGLAITASMIQGGGAAAWLFPLYWWMILGAGARLGAGFLGFAVALVLTGFGLVVAATPFWRGHATLSASLLLSLAVLPAYGAILLRNVAVARAEAERASRAKTLFLASVSHELRTPLTAIIGLTGLLEHGRLDAEQREMTRTLSDSAQTLLRQIEHLLSDARQEIRARDWARGSRGRDRGFFRAAGVPARHARGGGGGQGRAPRPDDRRGHPALHQRRPPQLARDPAERDRQRREIHPRRRGGGPRRRGAAAGRIVDECRGPRQRSRHSRRGATADLRALSPGRCVHRRKIRRRGARAFHCQAAARRHGRRHSGRKSRRGRAVPPGLAGDACRGR